MGERLDGAVEKAGNLVDRTAARISDGEAPQSPRPGTDERIIGVFPWFVAACLVLWIVCLTVTDWSGFGKIIELLCLSFTLCFAVLGFFLFFTIPGGVFSNRYNALAGLILTIVIWIADYITEDFYFAEAVDGIFGYIGIDMGESSVFTIGFLVTFAVVLFTSTGVVSVICAYLRRYVPQVLSSMNRHAEAGTRGKAERFFMIPDIIDVEGIVLDPPERSHIYDIRGFFSLATYLFVMGLLISSYLFVNPYFLDVMTEKSMLAVTIMLSMFIPALIIPWQVFRTIGAEAVSSAPRPYHLWQGARFRLFSTFTTLGVFMMMFLLSVYLGNDVASIIRTYASFMVPLLCISIMYAALYTNSFESVDLKVIQSRFEETEKAAGKRSRSKVQGSPTPTIDVG